MEAGKKYVLRNGLVTEEIREANNGTKYVFEAKVREPEHDTPTVACWLKSGRFLSDFTEHRLDIVSELND